ncbi:zinc finger domain-containing protein [Trichoderma austrokoningii]
MNTMLADKIFPLTVRNGTPRLERIGQGFCGSVWGELEEDGRPSSGRQIAMKREDGGPGRSITNEYRIHTRLLECLKSLDDSQILAIFGASGISFNIPESEAFIGKDAPEWADILPRFPPGYTPCNAIVSEKIMPVSLPFCRMMIDNFIPGVDADKILDTQTNKHCLIRTYLGRRRIQDESDKPRSLRAYSLRNFPLHIDQMESIGLSPRQYALSMADTLAFLYWIAKVDANDVEFVLAQPRSNGPPNMKPSDYLHSDILATPAMWVLDFDCCNDITMDESGIEQACRCFWRNDPFYPRPGSSHASDQKLWRDFQHRFLMASEEILKDEALAIKQLPGRLIERIIQTRGVYSSSHLM